MNKCSNAKDAPLFTPDWWRTQVRDLRIFLVVGSVALLGWLVYSRPQAVDEAAVEVPIVADTMGEYPLGDEPDVQAAIDRLAKGVNSLRDISNKMKAQIEEARGMNQEPTHELGVKYHLRRPAPDKLCATIANVEGVVLCFVPDRYTIQVYKGEAFTWAEVGERIKPIIESFDPMEQK